MCSFKEKHEVDKVQAAGDINDEGRGWMTEV